MKNLLMPESKYRIESYEPTPGQKRTQNMSELLQSIGGFTDRNNIPFLSSYADPRNANRTARQINNTFETVGDFIPGVSYELAKERNDDLGQNLAMLDLIPGGALPKKAIKEGIDKTKDMMFLHNTGSDALRNYDELGGLPSPSMGVTQKDLPFDKFGDITLVGKPGNFDPKVSASNKIYSSDAYTPRAPAPIQTTKRNSYDYLLEEYQPLAKKFDESIESEFDHVYQQSFKKHASDYRQDKIKDIFDSTTGKLKFLKDQGIELNPVMKQLKEFEIKPYKFRGKNMLGIFNKQTGVKGIGAPDKISDGSFQVPYGMSGREYLEEIVAGQTKPGIDRLATKKLVNDAVDKFKTSDFNAWKKAETEKVFNPEKFFESTNSYANKYAYNSNPKFKEYELDNLVNYMKKQPQVGGEQGMGSKGMGRLKSVLTGKFKNLDQIKQNKSQLVDKELPDNQELYEKTQNDFFEISNNLWEGSEKSINEFSFIDTVNDQIFEAIQKGGSKDAIKKSFAFLGDLPNAQVNKIEKFIKDLEKAPVEYFEAKPTRAVGLDEFSGAIVPQYTSQETLDLLNKYGLKREFYDPNNPLSRTQARNKFNEDMFMLPGGLLGGGLLGGGLLLNSQDPNNNNDI